MASDYALMNFPHLSHYDDDNYYNDVLYWDLPMPEGVLKQEILS